MLTVLRDPLWDGIAGIIALLALIVAISQSKTSKRTLVQQIAINVGRAILGILVFLPSVAIYLTLVSIIEGGIPLVMKNWEGIPFSRAFIYSLNYAIFPGTITAIAASRGRSFNHSVSLAIVAAFISTSISDIYLNLSNSEFNINQLLSALLANVIGGIVAGILIAYLVKIFNEAFAIHQP
jgi:hypothetical protein